MYYLLRVLSRAVSTGGPGALSFPCRSDDLLTARLVRFGRRVQTRCELDHRGSTGFGGRSVKDM